VLNSNLKAAGKRPVPLAQIVDDDGGLIGIIKIVKYNK
jgi:hypothetical protein